MFTFRQPARSDVVCYRFVRRFLLEYNRDNKHPNDEANRQYRSALQHAC